MPHPYRARAFGLRWASDTPLPLFVAAIEDGEADVVVSRRETVADRPGGTVFNNGIIFTDGFRFATDDATFDMIDGRRIDWVSATGAEPPISFYSTVTALLLAWRGAVPLHASAVAIGGRAILLSGPSGAGKSSLARALIARGGVLISDDLSLLAPMEAGLPPMLLPGRPAIRLLPDAASAGEPIDPLGKLSLRPPMIAQETMVPVRALALLRPAPAPSGAPAIAFALHREIFRPRWMQALPGHPARLALIQAVAQRIRVIGLPPAWSVPDASIEDRAAQVAALLAD